MIDIDYESFDKFLEIIETGFGDRDLTDSI